MMMRGGEAEALSGRISAMPSQLNQASAELLSMAGSTGNDGGQRTKEDKISQWGQQETKELIGIRADLERDFTVVRRNKTLWEAVSIRMRDKGYQRSPDQCKCKWKNLVNRYKGKETGEVENNRQCPFFEELHSVFTERARDMQRLLFESESGTTSRMKRNKKRIPSGRFSDELSDDYDDDEDSEEDQRPAQTKKRKTEKGSQIRTSACGISGGDKPRTSGGIHELLQEFMHKQQQMESHWWEMMERRAFERQQAEREWRQAMERLERERLMLETEWREREEQRRAREECRAEKRDALLTALLNKLIQDDL